jgi:hypothetical protein
MRYLTRRGPSVCMRLLLVGDVHGNQAWFDQVVLPAASMLDTDAIIQLGDFGYWPGRADAFLDAVKSSDIPVYFIDGNHEDHYALAYDVAMARAETGVKDTDAVPLGGSLWYLPRGSRLEFDGVAVAALGGARSIDRALRTPSVDWFMEEAVNDDDLARLAAGGTCEVLVCHDAPSKATLPLLGDHEIPEVWRRERPACEEHRRRIDEACDAVRPNWLVHGHYHCRARSTAEFAWGPVKVVSLAEDGTSPGANLAVLQIVKGDCEVRPVIEGS